MICSIYISTFIFIILCLLFYYQNDDLNRIHCDIFLKVFINILLTFKSTIFIKTKESEMNILKNDMVLFSCKLSGNQN